MNTHKPSSQEVETPNVTLTALAWISILILCIPQIIYRQFVQLAPSEPIKPIWLGIVEVAILAVLWLVSWVWTEMKPLRGYFLALVAYSVGTSLVRPLILYSAVWTNWEQHASWGV